MYMYNIADFLLVHLSPQQIYFKSARSSHVCLNYISTAQFCRSNNQNIRCHRNIIWKQICNCYAQSGFWL